MTAADSFYARMQRASVRAVNARMRSTANLTAANIKRSIVSKLQLLFIELGAAIPSFGDKVPDWFDEVPATAKLAWTPLHGLYTKRKGSEDFFMYSELPRPLKNSARSRALRRKTIATKKQSALSLNRTISAMGDPQRYFGEVSVVVLSNVKVDSSGNRRFIAGTILDDKKVGGQYVGQRVENIQIVVDWAPLLDGVDLMARGEIEQRLPNQNRLYQKLTNSQKGPSSYRPLLGPRLIWFQETKVKSIIRSAIGGN